MKDTTNHCPICEANAEKYEGLVEAAEKAVATRKYAGTLTGNIVFALDKLDAELKKLRKVG